MASLHKSATGMLLSLHSGQTGDKLSFRRGLELKLL